ncbi:unnamed protein product [Orchesella dallaii]|uniref:Uncharacterized protein n=1 Tax=Orchesella dallaii TaxID=48710 RepID=A0ABP1Q4H5_9HEXA
MESTKFIQCTGKLFMHNSDIDEELHPKTIFKKITNTVRLPFSSIEPILISIKAYSKHSHKEKSDTILPLQNTTYSASHDNISDSDDSEEEVIQTHNQTLQQNTTKNRNTTPPITPLLRNTHANLTQTPTASELETSANLIEFPQSEHGNSENLIQFTPDQSNSDNNIRFQLEASAIRNSLNPPRTSFVIITTSQVINQEDLLSPEFQDVTNAEARIYYGAHVQPLTATIYTSTAEIVFVYEPLHIRLSEFTKYRPQVGYVCKTNYPYCDIFYNFQKHLLIVNGLLTSVALPSTLVERKHRKSTRSRRFVSTGESFLPIIGKLNKLLFGVATEEDLASLGQEQIQVTAQMNLLRKYLTEDHKYAIRLANQLNGFHNEKELSQDTRLTFIDAEHVYITYPQPETRLICTDGQNSHQVSRLVDKSENHQLSKVGSFYLSYSCGCHISGIHVPDRFFHSTPCLKEQFATRTHRILALMTKGDFFLPAGYHTHHLPRVPTFNMTIASSLLNQHEFATPPKMQKYEGPINFSTILSDHASTLNSVSLFLDFLLAAILVLAYFLHDLYVVVSLFITKPVRADKHNADCYFPLHLEIMIFLILFYIAAVVTLQTFKILRKSTLTRNTLPSQSTSRFYVTPPGSPRHTNLPLPLAPIAPVAETSHSFQLDWDNTHEDAARAARLKPYELFLLDQADQMHQNHNMLKSQWIKI